jgi:hypothetical protein
MEKSTALCSYCFPVVILLSALRRDQAPPENLLKVVEDQQLLAEEMSFETVKRRGLARLP